MEYSLEQLNYFRICHVAFNLVPRGLRTIFRQEWDFLYSSTPCGKWQETSQNGHDFYLKETKPRKKTGMKNLYVNVIQNGNTAEWDGSCLFSAILFSTSIGSTLSATVRSGIDDLRQVRNDIAHASVATLTDAEFQNCVARILGAFNSLGLPIQDIEHVKNQTSFPTKEIKDLEKKVNDLKTELDQTKSELETTKNTLQGVHSDLCSAQEENRTLTQEINFKLDSFCSLTSIPPHEIVKRSSDVAKITKKMEELYKGNVGAVSTVYLSGNPGCGKSQLARQVGEELFCNRSRADDGLTFVFTLDAESVKTLVDSYLTIGRYMGVTEYTLTNLQTTKREKPNETILHIKRLILPKIKTFSRWLLIADNVVTLQKVIGFLPQEASTEWGHGQVLITTQDSSTVPPNSPYSYHESFSEGMCRDEAVKLLQQVSQIADQDEAERVAKVLGYQPLALAAAAYYVQTVVQHGSPKFRWSNYLEGLTRGQRETTENLLASESSAYPKTMTAAVRMAIERAVETDEVFQHLFSFLSLCSSELIPVEAAVKFIQTRRPGQPDGLIKAKILRSSLVLVSDYEEIGGTCLHVHALVHEVLKQQTNSNPHSYEKPQDVAAAMKIFTSLLQLENSKITKKRHPHLVLDILTSHCKSLLQNMSGQFIFSESSFRLEIMSAITFEEVVSWFCSFARACQTICDFCLARDLYEKELIIRKKSCGEDGADVPTSYDNLGEVYYNTAQYTEAKEFGEKALMIRKKFFGEEHADVARSYNNLGAVYSKIGQYTEAKEFHEKALMIGKKIFGEENTDVARSYDNLGAVYLKIGQYTKAKEFHEKALMIRKKIFGEEHADVARSYDNFGTVYSKIGQYTEAKEFHEKALMIRKKIFGDENADVAVSYDNLGAVYYNTAQYTEAKEFHEKAVMIGKKMFGEEHADVATSYNNLGAVYCKTGQYTEAKEFHEKAVMIRQKIFGEEHADVATSYKNLGVVYFKTGQYTEAKEFHEKAVMIRKKIFGEEHADVARCYDNLGAVYFKIGQYTEAKEFHEKALMIRKKIFGEEHADVARSYDNLGAVMIRKKTGHNNLELVNKEVEKQNRERKHCVLM